MPRVTLGVSLKMYFGHRRALDWLQRVVDVACAHPAVSSGEVDLFVAPTFVQLLSAVGMCDGTPVRIAAQDLGVEDIGAYTGEVSGVELAEIGVQLVEVGHAERRVLFGETDRVVAAKTAAALRNGLTPILCLGEVDRQGSESAAHSAIAQLDASLHGAPDGRIIVAYEPMWAIGAAEPASTRHIAAVTAALRETLASLRPGSLVVYGGSAGPGLLSRLGHAVDGLFLGRFAHDPAAIASLLDEAASLPDR